MTLRDLVVGRTANLRPLKSEKDVRTVRVLDLSLSAKSGGYLFEVEVIEGDPLPNAVNGRAWVAEYRVDFLPSIEERESERDHLKRQPIQAHADRA